MKLQKLLLELDAIYESDPTGQWSGSRAAAIVNEVSVAMATAGHPELVRAPVPDCDIIDAKRYLAACIAATKEQGSFEVDPEYLTIKQAAEKLQLSERSIARMIENGLQVSRVGKAVRIKPADLELYLSDQETVFD